eukprot:5868132-Pyramimonas_sp.AAC.1
MKKPFRKVLADAVGIHQVKVKGRRGNPKDASGETIECVICHSARHFRRECPQGDGRGRGLSMHLAQTDSDMQYVDWGSLLADPADGSATVIDFVAAGYLSARMALESYADELFEEVFTGHDD